MVLLPRRPNVTQTTPNVTQTTKKRNREFTIKEKRQQPEKRLEKTIEEKKEESKVNFFVRLPKALWNNVIDFLVERPVIDDMNDGKFRTNHFIWHSLNLVTKSFHPRCYEHLFIFEIGVDACRRNIFHQFCLNENQFRWNSHGLQLGGYRQLRGNHLSLGRCCFTHLTNMTNLRQLYLCGAYTDDYSCLTKLQHLCLELDYYYDPLVLPETIFSLTLWVDSRKLRPKQKINIPSKCKKLKYVDDAPCEENPQQTFKLVLNGELVRLQTNVVPDLNKVPNLQVLQMLPSVNVQDLKNLTSCSNLKELGVARMTWTNFILQFSDIDGMFFRTIETLNLDEVCACNCDCEWLKRFVNLKTLRFYNMAKENKYVQTLFALPSLRHIYWQNENSQSSWTEEHRPQKK